MLVCKNEDLFSKLSIICCSMERDKNIVIKLFLNKVSKRIDMKFESRWIRMKMKYKIYFVFINFRDINKKIY